MRTTVTIEDSKGCKTSFSLKSTDENSCSVTLHSIGVIHDVSDSYSISISDRVPPFAIWRGVPLEYLYTSGKGLVILRIPQLQKESIGSTCYTDLPLGVLLELVEQWYAKYLPGAVVTVTKEEVHKEFWA